MASLTTQTAIGAYRKLLRTVAATFRSDDFALTAARKEIRDKFEEYRHHETDSAQMRDLIAEAYDTADFIRSHVVQAAENEQGNYSMSVNEAHTVDEMPKVTMDKTVPEPQKCS